MFRKDGKANTNPESAPVVCDACNRRIVETHPVILVSISTQVRASFVDHVTGARFVNRLSNRTQELCWQCAGKLANFPAEQLKAFVKAADEGDVQQLNNLNNG